METSYNSVTGHPITTTTLTEVAQRCAEAAHAARDFAEAKRRERALLLRTMADAVDDSRGALVDFADHG